jgi:hypothetical protein
MVVARVSDLALITAQTRTDILNMWFYASLR